MFSTARVYTCDLVPYPRTKVLKVIIPTYHLVARGQARSRASMAFEMLTGTGFFCQLSCLLQPTFKAWQAAIAKSSKGAHVSSVIHSCDKLQYTNTLPSVLPAGSPKERTDTVAFRFGISCRRGVPCVQRYPFQAHSYTTIRTSNITLPYVHAILHYHTHKQHHTTIRTSNLTLPYAQA
jgi:hypothetical protein